MSFAIGAALDLPSAIQPVIVGRWRMIALFHLR
jgi:hypothetical protein